MPVKIIEDSAAAELTELAPRRTHDRDDDQKTIDTWTAELVKAYDEAGRPGEDSYAGPSRAFATDDSPDAKRRVARAFALVNHDRKNSDGKVAALWFKNGKPDGEGYVTVKYGARIMPAKEAAAETPNTEPNTEPNAEPKTDGDTPPFEPNAEPGGDQPTGRGFGRKR